MEENLYFIVLECFKIYVLVSFSMVTFDVSSSEVVKRNSEKKLVVKK
jgi:hypothetical protein